MNIEYLFLEKDYERQIKVMDIQIKLLFLILAIFIFILVILMSSIIFEMPKDKELELTKEWIQEVKPIYLSLAKNITFTSDLNYFTNVTNATGILGQNQNRKYLYILLTGSPTEDKNTLLHELAHCYVNTGNQNVDEQIVKDIAKSNSELR